jgi:hypothetical protein
MIVLLVPTGLLPEKLPRTADLCPKVFPDFVKVAAW